MQGSFISLRLKETWEIVEDLGKDGAARLRAGRSDDEAVIRTVVIEPSAGNPPSGKLGS
jgi:hypothetical protein